MSSSTLPDARAEHLPGKWWNPFTKRLHAGTGSWPCAAVLKDHYCNEPRNHGPHHVCKDNDCGFRWLA